MMTVRSQLEELLKPLLPSGWSIDTTRNNLDVTDRVVVKLAQQRITRTPEAPYAHHTVMFTAAVVDYGQSFDREDELDEEVSTFLFALDALHGTPVKWTDATRSKFDESHPNAYDISLSIITQKE